MFCLHFLFPNFMSHSMFFFLCHFFWEGKGEWWKISLDSLHEKNPPAFSDVVSSAETAVFYGNNPGFFRTTLEQPSCHPGDFLVFSAFRLSRKSWWHNLFGLEMNLNPKVFTPLKTEMSPKKGPFQNERIISPALLFRGRVSFWGSSPSKCWHFETNKRRFKEVSRWGKRWCSPEN